LLGRITNNQEVVVKVYQLNKSNGKLYWTKTIDINIDELKNYIEDDNYKWTTDFSIVQTINNNQ